MLGDWQSSAWYNDHEKFTVKWYPYYDAIDVGLTFTVFEV